MLFLTLQVCGKTSRKLEKNGYEELRREKKAMLKTLLHLAFGAFLMHSCVIVSTARLTLTFNLASVSHAKNPLFPYAAFTDSRKSQCVQKRLQAQISKVSHKRCSTSQNDLASHSASFLHANPNISTPGSLRLS